MTVAECINAPVKSMFVYKECTACPSKGNGYAAGPTGDGTNDVLVSCVVDTGTLADSVADTVKEVVDTTSSEKSSTASEEGASEGWWIPVNTSKHTKTIVSLNPGNAPLASAVSVPTLPSLTSLTYSSA